MAYLPDFLAFTEIMIQVSVMAARCFCSYLISHTLKSIIKIISYAVYSDIF